MTGNRMKQLPFKFRSKARGYTLMELIIAIGLGVAIMLALMLMFSRNSGDQQELERTVRQMENARFSVDTLTEDVMHAGFYSDFNPNTVLPAPVITSPDPCAVQPTAQGWVSPDPVVGTVMQMPRPVEGITAATAVACLANRRPNTEAIVIRRAETGPTIDLAAASANNLYIQTARCRDEVGQFRIAAGQAAAFNLMPSNCTSGTVNNAVRRLLQRTYYVATCNDCANNDGIPTLKRFEVINGNQLTTSVAEGVENLQFEFGVDTSGDGVPDATFTAGAVPAADWQNVVSVRMHVLTRSERPSPGHADARTYQLGPNVALTPADGFKRTLFATTVRLNNVGSRRE